MKKILAVNIDSVSLNIISSLLTEHTTDFEVLTTASLGEVDEIIKKLSPTVVVIDLENPAPGDLKILDYLVKSHPRTIILVMTGFETGEIETTIKSLSSLQYFTKPADFRQVADTIFNAIETGVGGQIQGISLTSFLQMSEMERTSCTLKIKTDESAGYLYLVKGSLVAARTENYTGEEAVYEILAWQKPVIEIADAKPDNKKEIKTPLMNLLMEGARRKDEIAADQKKKGTDIQAPHKVSITPAETALGKEAAKKPAQTRQPESAEKKTPKEDAEAEAALSEEQAAESLATGKITDASQILKKQRLASRLTKAAAAVVCLVVVAVLWSFVAQPWLAEKKFKKTIQSAENAPTLEDKLAILDDYLATDPATRYEIEIKRRQQSYRENMKTQAFEETVARVNDLEIDEDFVQKATAIYKSFLQEHPQSGYTREVQKRIKELPAVVDDAAYRKLLKIPENQYSQRFTAYTDYLTRHSDSANADKVRKMLAGLGDNLYRYILSVSQDCVEQGTCQRTLELCAYFLKKFNNHPRRQEVADLQQRVKDRLALARLTKEAREKGIYSEEAKKLYADYLAENPQTTIRKRLETEISRIENFQAEEKRWRQMQNYAGNEEADIFDRYNRIAQYVQNGPPERYREKAAALLAWLRQKKNQAEDRLDAAAAREEERRAQEAAIANAIGQIRKKMLHTGSRYVEQYSRIITDTRTGLMWCMLDSSVLTGDCLTYKEAQAYVENLTTGGFNDWRLPTPTELLVIYNSSPPFPAGNASWYWTSEVISAAWHRRVNTARKMSDGTWRKGETELDRCGTVRAVRP